MDKEQVASLLSSVAGLLELQAEANPFEARAYQSAARILLTLDGNIDTLLADGTLANTHGIGATLYKRIEEIVTTGTLALLEELEKKTPKIKIDLLQIPGLGPKKINVLVQTLSISSLADLQNACEQNKVADISGFGKKTQDNILHGLALLREHQRYTLYPDALSCAQQILEVLQRESAIIRTSIAGSLRRRREIVKDIDIVASIADDSDATIRTYIADILTHMPIVESIIGAGDTKISIRLTSGIAVDIRLVFDAQFVNALHHFTGSKEHNIALRHLAKEHGLTLNEYGLFPDIPDKSSLLCTNETELYENLRMQYIPPEIREDTGEIESALKWTLPTLIEQKDIQGILHVHSVWSDGKNTIQELVLACIDRGMHYLGITDHSQIATYAHGLHGDDLYRQRDEIEELNEQFHGKFTILQGVECDILKDGSLDLADSVLESLDFVIASVHSHFTLSKREQTQRIVHALQNPYTDILGHPTGRLLLQREGYQLDMETILDTANKQRMSIEINSHPLRLDLDWHFLHHAKSLDIPLLIAPDAHTISGLDDIQYGIGIARKGWLEAGDVLNTYSCADIQAWFQARRTEAMS